ncbi:MAG: CRISPR-associated endonuclease Cas2 [Actinomycetota bacterium]
MLRRRYLAAYDIRDEKRLRLVHKTMKEFGFPMQYSVFICDLDASEKITFKMKVLPLMDQRADSLVLVDLGDPSTRGLECFEFLGTSLPLPKGGPGIV